MHPKIALVFPGQGSQYVGMLSNLYGSNQIIKQTFEEASFALNYDLWQLVKHGPAEQLNQTEFTPALLPAITTCPGALKLAASTVLVLTVAASLHAATTSASAKPKIAAIAPPPSP